MLDFVKKAFRNFIEVILWINLMLSAIAGGIGGYLIDGGGFAFLGVIIGLIIGLLTDIIMGGFIATILNIDKNIEELNDQPKNLKKIEERANATMKEKYRNIEDLFQWNKNVMEEAENLRKTEGKTVYIEYLKSQAEKLGLGRDAIDLTEDDIE
jgi:hypothetical protein